LRQKRSTPANSLAVEEEEAEAWLWGWVLVLVWVLVVLLVVLLVWGCGLEGFRGSRSFPAGHPRPRTHTRPTYTRTPFTHTPSPICTTWPRIRTSWTCPLRLPHSHWRE
jgi:hypothetical protein